jgi:hypothetical protein
VTDDTTAAEKQAASWVSETVSLPRANLPENLDDLAREIKTILKNESVISARFNQELRETQAKFSRDCENIESRKDAATRDLRIEAGRLLIAAKAKVDPGKWRQWLRDNINRSPSDCYQCMKVAGADDPEKEHEKQKTDTRSRVQKHRDTKRAKRAGDAAHVSVTPPVTDTPTPRITLPEDITRDAPLRVRDTPLIEAPPEGTTVVNGEVSTPLPFDDPATPEQSIEPSIETTTAPPPEASATAVVPSPEISFEERLRQVVAWFSTLDDHRQTKVIGTLELFLQVGVSAAIESVPAILVDETEPLSDTAAVVTEPPQANPELEEGLSPTARNTLRKFEEHAKRANPGPPWLSFQQLEGMDVTEDAVDELLTAGEIVYAPGNPNLVGIEPDWMRKQRLAQVVEEAVPTGAEPVEAMPDTGEVISAETTPVEETPSVEPVTASPAPPAPPVANAAKVKLTSNERIVLGVFKNVAKSGSPYIENTVPWWKNLEADIESLIRKGLLVASPDNPNAYRAAGAAL